MQKCAMPRWDRQESVMHDRIIKKQVMQNRVIKEQVSQEWNFVGVCHAGVNNTGMSY
jgi:hypothetical protein